MTKSFTTGLYKTTTIINYVYTVIYQHVLMFKSKFPNLFLRVMSQDPSDQRLADQLEVITIVMLSLPVSTTHHFTHPPMYLNIAVRAS